MKKAFLILAAAFSMPSANAVVVIVPRPAFIVPRPVIAPRPAVMPRALPARTAPTKPAHESARLSPTPAVMPMVMVIHGKSEKKCEEKKADCKK